MDVNWRILLIAVISYAFLTMLGLAATMAISGNGNGNFILPFMVFAGPCIMLLFGSSSEPTSNQTRILGITGMIVVSFSTFVASHFFPSHIDRPHFGPIATAISAMLVIPLVLLYRRSEDRG